MVLSKTRGASTLLLIMLLPSLLLAEDKVEQNVTVATAYYFPHNQGYGLYDGELFAPISYDPVTSDIEGERDLGSTWGGAELQATYNISLTKDFLAGSDPLTTGNNIKYAGKFAMTPVNMELGGSITVTPIAFLNFQFGQTFLSGWYLDALGVSGLALNDETDGISTDAFDGVLSQTWLTGTFQFDTAAVMSGDTTWKHIIVLTSHTFKHRYNSAAGDDDPWSVQGTEGDNYNGFMYNTTSVLAYQMPLVLNLAGILVETEADLFDNADRTSDSGTDWGADHVQVRFGGLFNFKLNEKHSISVLPQFITKPNYTDETVQEEYFENRVIDSDNPYYIAFDRIAISYKYNF